MQDRPSGPIAHQQQSQVPRQSLTASSTSQVEMAPSMHSSEAIGSRAMLAVIRNRRARRPGYRNWDAFRRSAEMNTPGVAHHRSHRFVHAAGTFLLLSMLLGPLLSVPAGAAADRQVPQGLLDLPAMVLTPDDLQSASFDDYGLGYSEMMFEDAFVASTAVNRDMSEDDVRSF